MTQHQEETGENETDGERNENWPFILHNLNGEDDTEGHGGQHAEGHEVDEPAEGGDGVGGGAARGRVFRQEGEGRQAFIGEVDGVGAGFGVWGCAVQREGLWGFWMREIGAGAVETGGGDVDDSGGEAGGIVAWLGKGEGVILDVHTFDFHKGVLRRGVGGIELSGVDPVKFLEQGLGFAWELLAAGIASEYKAAKQVKKEQRRKEAAEVEVPPPEIFHGVTIEPGRAWESEFSGRHECCWR